MAVSNARNLPAGRKGLGEEDLMRMVKSVLRLKRTPNRIEGLDISNLLGSMAVGTVVSYRQGLPYKSGYRNYRIREIKGIDDYGMISELVLRRLSQGDAPDLFLVDGGRGHLSAVKRVVENFHDKEAPQVVAIAKADDSERGNRDKIYLAGRKNPVLLKPGDPVLLLLMRIRDEAHRRAINYHRKLRDKDLKKSRLDLIPGIGPKKKSLLLRHFGDIEAMSKARPEELALVPGISDSLARDIADFLLKEPLEKDDILLKDKG
jgi:excinuclease ABC subunit C